MTIMPVLTRLIEGAPVHINFRTIVQWPGLAVGGATVTAPQWAQAFQQRRMSELSIQGGGDRWITT